jgi:serine O-acetyltransferase
LHQDIDRYVYAAEREGRCGRSVIARVALLSPGMWALLAYRLTHFALTRVRPRALSGALATATFLLQRVLHLMTGIEIDVTAHIGPGLFIPHRGTIVIGEVRMGRCCNVAQGVTLGRSSMDPENADTPTFGDRVWIGPNAVVAGPLHIGSDATIGANSVPMRDVPARGVVLGVPARMVSDRGSFTQVAYRGMDDDPDRGAAMQQNKDAA